MNKLQIWQSKDKFSKTYSNCSGLLKQVTFPDTEYVEVSDVDTEEDEVDNFVEVPKIVLSPEDTRGRASSEDFSVNESIMKMR